MRKPLFLSFVAALSFLLTSCGTTLNNAVSPSSGSVPVSLTMTDDPPSGVAVLFFQVSLTGASLQPATGTGPSISLLAGNNPIQIDVTQLQALSAFLGSVSVPAGTYGSLSLTFADPQLVIFNQSDTALGSSCAVGSICKFTPAIDNSATVNFTSAPFPVTVAANSPLGFLIDFHLNTVIQSDLSVDLGVPNGITLAALPPAAASAVPQFGFVTGIVGAVNSSQNQFTLATPSGKTVTIDVNSSTVFADWPPCASPGTLGCLTAGAIVQVQVASVESDGSLLAAKITWLKLQAANRQVVEGTIVGYSATQMRLIMHANPTATAASAVPLGGMATVTFDRGATFSVDSNGFTIPSGLNFSGIQNLALGQEVQVAVDPSSMSCVTPMVIPIGGSGPPATCTFSTNNVQLEPSQISGVIGSIDASASSFAMGTFPCIAFGPWTPSATVAIAVDTTSQTVYRGFPADDFSGLAAKDLVSVNGWLFENDNGILDTVLIPPVVLAQTVVLHPGGTI